MAKNYTYEEIMKLEEVPFFAVVVEEFNAKEWLKEALTRKEKRETYPRKKVLDANGNPIQKISKKNGKPYFVMEADYSKKPSLKMSKISFFSVKKAFCEEVLHLEKKTPEVKETFRTRMDKMLAELED